MEMVFNRRMLGQLVGFFKKRKKPGGISINYFQIDIGLKFGYVSKYVKKKKALQLKKNIEIRHIRTKKRLFSISVRFLVRFIYKTMTKQTVYLNNFAKEMADDLSNFYQCLLFNPSQKALVFTCLQYNSFENTVGKGEIARNEQFLLFPQCFLPVWRTFCHFHQT